MSGCAKSPTGQHLFDWPQGWEWWDNGGCYYCSAPATATAPTDTEAARTAAKNSKKKSRGALAKEHATAKENTPIKEQIPMSKSIKMPATFRELIRMAHKRGMKPSELLDTLGPLPLPPAGYVVTEDGPERWIGPEAIHRCWIITPVWAATGGKVDHALHVWMPKAKKLTPEEALEFSEAIAAAAARVAAVDHEPAGTGGGVDSVRSTFTADPENPNLYWGPEFDGVGSKISTYRLSATGEAGVQVETPETMTGAEARELAASLTAAADYLDRA